MKSKITIILLTLFFGVIISGFSQKADTVILKGVQVRTGNANVKLQAIPVYLTKQYVIAKVSGDTTGFWIENGKGQIIKSFRHSQDAVGFILPKGQYKVIPNLPPGQATAIITVLLKAKGQ